jgi:hypothetical protein
MIHIARHSFSLRVKELFMRHDIDISFEFHAAKVNNLPFNKT